MKSRVKDYVLCAIANDYEDFVTVSKEVSGWAQKHGGSVSRSELVDAITELINEGLAQAYILSPDSRHPTAVKCSEQDIEDLWFYATPDGRRAAELQSPW